MAPKPPKESPPVLHSAIPGQGLYSIGDASGNRRWIGSGREVNGWKVGDYDKKSNTLMVTKGDRKEYLQMGSGSISDYIPPVATPNAETIGGNGGQLSETEQELNPNQSMKNNISSLLNENGEINREQFLKMKSLQNQLQQAMNIGRTIEVPTATPQVPSEPLKTYQKIDENGKIQNHYYRGDLPDDAMRYGDQ